MIKLRLVMNMKNKQPLAYRLKPKKINDLIGQEHIIGPNKFINNMIEKEELFSLILYGPPGIGKTSIANVIINELDLPNSFFNAAIDNKKKLQQIISTAELFDNYILVLDEIHRMTTNIQDYLLPFVENGTVTLIGMTTHNPYYSVNPAIRSRCHLIKLYNLENKAIKKYLKEIADNILKIEIEDEVFDIIISNINGDLRSALNQLEMYTLMNNNEKVTKESIEKFIPMNTFSIDKNDDGYYDTLSAFQKSIRGSDVNAAIHYLARLIKADDLKSITRRLAVIAYEDIGLANPDLCARTIAAIEAAERVGFPEARIPLSNVVIELALSPKSMTAYKSLDRALSDIEKKDIGDIPEFIKYNPINPPIKYDATNPEKWRWEYLPSKLRGIEYFITKNNPTSYESKLLSNYEKIKKYKKLN